MTQSPKTLYTAHVHVTGGREGAARSSDGRLDIKLAAPGGTGGGTNPEQLFAAGWSACFEGAMGIAAKQQGVSLPADLAIDAEVDLRLGDDGYTLAARLKVSLPGLDPAQAQAVIDAASRTCPYSKAVAGNIDAAVILV
ncbi:organic hydroperoxide resistance protein [Novosphingobium sp. PS1R-30]|uniref:Organic hydroperoxide resistance protein n=1 Tax=Novosphingobium anseongense TaxID=3133436 RepID=A0ABU8RTG4_9SPHN